MKVRVAYTVEVSEQDRLALQQMNGGRMPTRKEIQGWLEHGGRSQFDADKSGGYAKLAATFQQRAGGDGADAGR